MTALACVAASIPASAQAATNFGSVAQPTTFGYANTAALTTIRDPGGATHAGSPVAGVLVKAQIRTRGGGGSGFIRVLRLSSTTAGPTYNFLNVGENAVTVTADATVGGHVTDVATRIPIAVGDRLGLVFPSDFGGSIKLANKDATGGECAYGSADHAVGSLTGMIEGGCNQNIPLLAGVVEADADGDGYGDETQDACTSNPERQAAPCTFDAAVSIPRQRYKIVRSRTKTSITLKVRVKNRGSIPASNVRLALKRGKPIASAEVLKQKKCTRAADRKSCTIAALPGGTSVYVLVRIESRKAGRGKLSASISSGPVDSSLANNKISKRFSLRLKS